MLKVGLTGGIGAGKSAVAAELARLGARVIDADVLSREVVAPGGDGLREVVARFGAGVLCADGSLDRTALGARVFGDPVARRDLEAIIHPRVRARTAQLVAAAPDDAIVVNDVPLLVETGLAPGYHLVVVVTAAEATRVERLVSARSMAPADAYARIRAQADEASRRAAADALLVNDGSLEDLRSAVRALWLDRLVPFEANLREGRPAARPAAPVVVDPDPDWPARAHRLIARFAAAAAGEGGLLRIDHVGSTAVPGLPARDIIDIQAVVADADAAAMLAAAGRAAGFVPAAGRSGPAVPHRGAVGPAGAGPAGAGPAGGAPVGDGLPDGGPSGGGPAGGGPVAGESAGDWPVAGGLTGGGPVNGGHTGYTLVEADPGCPATIVLRPADDPRWREVLLLRDWLRDDTRQRDAFAVAKRDLAGWPGVDLVGYGRATAQWMSTALPLARHWAVNTAWVP